MTQAELRAGFLFGWLIVLVAVYAASTAYYVQVRATVLQNIADLADAQVQQTKLTASALMNAVGGATHAMATHASEIHNERTPALIAREQTFNDLIKQRMAGVRTFISIGTDGVIRNDTRPQRPAIGVNVADREYFTVHRRGVGSDLFVSEPVISRIDRKLTWVVSAPSRDANGNLVAVIAASLDREYFSKAMHTSGRLGGIHILLLHENGTVLEISSPSKVIGDHISDAARDLSATLIQDHPILSDFAGTAPETVIGPGDFGNWPLQVAALVDSNIVAVKLATYQRAAILTALGLSALSSIIIYLAFRVAISQQHARTLAERATEMKTQFLASMSHEFRTPLNAIVGFSEVMSAELFGPIKNEKYRDYALAIQKSGVHLVDLVDDLLDLSRIESGSYALEEVDIDVAAALQEAVEDRRRASNGNCGKSIRLDIEPYPPALRGDRRAFTQIIDNLLSNAWKFTGPTGNIVISWHTKSDGAGSLRVSDDGIGIDPQDLRHLTQPFVQGRAQGNDDPYVTRKTVGVGLGLSIVKQLADLHQAIFVINGRLNHGTSATLTFPKERIIQVREEVTTMQAAAPTPEGPRD